MFNLSKGALKELKNLEKSEDPEINILDSKIIRLDCEHPVLVKVTKINFHKKTSKIILRLFDGLDFVECVLDFSYLGCLSDAENTNIFNQENVEPIREDKRICLGTVILILEFNYKDIFLDDSEMKKDMLFLLKYASVGLDTNHYIEKDSSIERQFLIENLHSDINNLNWFIIAKVIKIDNPKEFKNQYTHQHAKYVQVLVSDATGRAEIIAFDQNIDKIKNIYVGNIYKISNTEFRFSKGYEFKLLEENIQIFKQLVLKKNSTLAQHVCDVGLFKIFEKNVSKNSTKDEQQLNRKVCDNFYKLNELLFKKEGSVVNTIGIIVKEERLKEITPKFKSPIKLKNFFICDETLEETKVSLWGKQAESVVTTIGNVYVFKKVKIINYIGQIGISVVLESDIVKINDKFEHKSTVEKLENLLKEKLKMKINCKDGVNF